MTSQIKMNSFLMTLHCTQQFEHFMLVVKIKYARYFGGKKVQADN